MPKYPGIRSRITELLASMSGDRNDAALKAARQADAAEIGRRADQRRLDRAMEQPMSEQPTSEGPIDDQAGDEPPDASDAR